MRSDRWLDVARGAGLLAPSGAVASTIFAEMSELAIRTGAVNLGQGFPDVDGPVHLCEAAIAAIREGHNQYPPGAGIPQLRHAVAAHQERHYGLTVDPETEVLVTAGATEALAATILALAGPGDEVLTLEPFYDSYAASIAMAGATHRTIPMRPGPQGFTLEAEQVRAAFTDCTRLVLINTPHNPTGAVLRTEDLTLLAEQAAAHDAVIVTDEVYEHLTYDGVAHVPIATLPAAAGRTLTISSAGKTLSFTGWKVGWLHGPAELVTAVRTVKQFLTYATSGPFQHAVAVALADDDGATREYVGALAASLQSRRDLLLGALDAAGFAAVRPEGTYFVAADAAPLGFTDAAELCRRLPELAGVVAVPLSAFCAAGSPTHELLRSWVRFTFVKQESVLRQGAEALASLRA
ncbi:aminotransferase class I/II-fold pyridoxal phosphate-dependent enzyme [Bogoriella caseilytica]|uniref:Succinyldiaminopimelate aminotransferase n=1 Tax=Bogoriella caseilytica TaxID=56055 RepID=A0A3N2BDF1_9MICO|nr:aminotransferase class I/II-fold pyridoxal phosphate-dependent enzyme [Bogoriella caseilytica]ROR73279.1 succinyldiaminopimelate aminotransferase [Bogoriella caseilytica]